MKISACLALAALTILPNLAMAYTEIDQNQIQFANISDEEIEKMMAVNYRDYFSPSCQHQIILDLSPLDLFPQAQKELGKVIVAKGHKVMLEPQDNSYPLRTIYFTAVEISFQNIGKRQINHNTQAQLDIELRTSDEHANISMTDLEKTLLSDEAMQTRNFQLVVGVSAMVKESTAPSEIIEIDKANMREESSDPDVQVSSIPGHMPLAESIKRFATARMNGLAFKELQRLGLEKLFKETESRDKKYDGITLDLEEALIVKNFDPTQRLVYKAIVDGLPNCDGNRAAFKPSSKK